VNGFPSTRLSQSPIARIVAGDKFRVNRVGIAARHSAAQPAAELVLCKTVRGTMTRNISAFATKAGGLPRGQDAEIKKPAHRVDERAQGEHLVT
jgi:hypothetical protein